MYVVYSLALLGIKYGLQVNISHCIEKLFIVSSSAACLYMLYSVIQKTKVLLIINKQPQWS